MKRISSFWDGVLAEKEVFIRLGYMGAYIVSDLERLLDGRF